MFGRLRNKIIFSFCVLMVGGGALSTTLVSRTMSRTLGAAVDRSGSTLAEVLADQLTEPLAYRDRLTTHRVLTGARESNADLVYAFVVGPDGTIIDHSFPVDRFPADLLPLARTTGPRTVQTEDGTLRHLTFPIARGVLGTLHVGVSMTWVDAATADAVSNVLVTTLIAMGAGILGILLLAHLITRPVLALRDAADRLGRGDIGAEAPVMGSDELADLARTFNRMAAQIRERIAESEALRAYVERVLDQMESGIMVVSGSRRVEYANRTAVRRHGPLEDVSCFEVMAGERPCDHCPVPEVLDTGQVLHRTYRAASGRTYELKWVPIIGRNGQPAVVERALDVTERLEVRERLERAQRLAVAGEISAGIVHAVNNPLDGVRRALDLAADRPEDPERVQRMLGLAKEGTDRIAGITRTLLSFARGDEAQDPVPVAVDALAEAAVSLSRLKADARQVTIETDLEPDLPEVWMDPQGMEEVLVNLVLNAVDACPDGGKVRVSAHTRDETLEISVQDSGPGIPVEAAQAVFEPFFTTKDTAHGTGLGLPVARRVVEAHGGELVLEEAELGGARFVARIPLRPAPQSLEGTLG